MSRIEAIREALGRIEYALPIRSTLDEPYEGRIVGNLGGTFFRFSLDDAAEDVAEHESREVRAFCAAVNSLPALLRAVDAARASNEALSELAHFGHISGGSIDNDTYREMVEPLMLKAWPKVEALDAALAALEEPR